MMTNMICDIVIYNKKYVFGLPPLFYELKSFYTIFMNVFYWLYGKQNFKQWPQVPSPNPQNVKCDELLLY